MREKFESCEFSCPEIVPPGAPDDFCIPEQCCPDQIATPKFPSPTTCLPEEVQRELEERIDVVNELLLNLALSGEQPEEARRDAFDGLMGQFIRVKLTCEKEVLTTKKRMSVKKKQMLKKKILARRPKGCVNLVGWDFVQLKHEDTFVLIPFEKICFIKSEGPLLETTDEPQLTNIDPCFRRDLAYNFGEVVSSSPELIQLFFRIRLNNFLLLLLDKEAEVKLDNQLVKGKLIDLSRESITICREGKEDREIPLDVVCFMKFKEGLDVD
ncbi:hypothetical protein KDJ21_024040 [Metabacillus litoralis]|uniref:hypothetical protein n=1 Tax=Metabacillus litoralis TaxID=152268 RepID=UPI001B990B7C|nr:hypothetical protein [Metabacillus litoralis]UHA59773.1 hypothetical protein KDJ21_024040 [Metabacillus litoralis]